MYKISISKTENVLELISEIKNINVPILSYSS